MIMCMWILRGFPDDGQGGLACCNSWGHKGLDTPSCSAFIHRVALEEVSGHRVLIKSKTEKSWSFGTKWQPTPVFLPGESP